MFIPTRFSAFPLLLDAEFIRRLMLMLMPAHLMLMPAHLMLMPTHHVLPQLGMNSQAKEGRRRIHSAAFLIDAPRP